MTCNIERFDLPGGYAVLSNAAGWGVYQPAFATYPTFATLLWRLYEGVPDSHVHAFLAAMNADAARVAELEAQNKALRESIIEADKGLAAAILAMNNMQIADTKDDALWALFTQTVAARAAIQKSRKAK
jgi:hypothetical protein